MYRIGSALAARPHVRKHHLVTSIANPAIYNSQRKGGHGGGSCLLIKADDPKKTQACRVRSTHGRA
ncbi:hypothetical protein DPMN_188575 [Dreissena polymorpha]|uniref:Uncharacterized protein n=1 Tax=Dreissena polymorpha TaxID=45954 RepID=A0A9D4DTP0_DREPO|nr:hypothetical protein DPMN_188575 [Dreissena polymorpha]